MGIELAPGELRELNVSMSTIGVVSPLTVVQQFIGTKDWGDWTSPDYRAYITLRNQHAAAVSGTIEVFDWQEWFGGERRWEKKSFTIDPNQIGRFSWNVRKMLRNEHAYVRFEVEIGGFPTIDIPPFWFMPGKQHPGPGAVGECYHSEPGLAILWYSQGSETDNWDGFYRHPPPLEGAEIHGGSIPVHRLRDYGDTGMWRAVFLGVFNPGFISGARYYSSVTGCPHCLAAIFEWTQA